MLIYDYIVVVVGFLGTYICVIVFGSSIIIIMPLNLQH